MGQALCTDTTPMDRPADEVFTEFHVFDHALRCRIAYEGTNTIKSEQFNWVFDNVDLQAIHIDEADLTCVVETQNDVQWIVIVGSKDIDTHLSSFDMEWSDTEAAYLHHSFLRLADITWEKIRTLIQNKTIRITGHSVGAAVAAILALRLLNNEYNMKECVTFSQPKVTDEEGVDDVFNMRLCQDSRYLRIVNDGDPCILLPPESVGFSTCLSTRMYKHFGPELKLLKEKNHQMVYISEHPVDENQANLYWSQLSWNLRESQEHTMGGYLTALMPHAPANISQEAKSFFRV